MERLHVIMIQSFLKIIINFNSILTLWSLERKMFKENREQSYPSGSPRNPKWAITSIFITYSLFDKNYMSSLDIVNQSNGYFDHGFLNWTHPSILCQNPPHREGMCVCVYLSCVLKISTLKCLPLFRICTWSRGFWNMIWQQSWILSQRQTQVS